MKKAVRLLIPVAALGLAGFLPGVASAAGGTSYQANLAPQNHSGASGSVQLTLNGNQATVTEHVSGLASTFMGAPYPHVQHIHISGDGVCPTPSADKNGDGIVDTVEGQPSYGPIGTTLSTSGDTSAKAGTDIKIAPGGGSFTYSRTITLDSASLASVQAGKGVVVVHGLDPATLSKQAQAEKSHLVPTLPLAATSPALCGTLQASQMGAMPSGSANTGGGSTSGIQDEGLLALGGGLILAAGGAFVARRRLARES